MSEAVPTWQWFRGDYRSWDEARAGSTGYDHPDILARVVSATRQVKSGRAAFERDGVTRTMLHQNYPLLSTVFRVAAGRENRIRLLDFGGSLGSAYWQHRAALGSLAALEWRVVEQPHYVRAGKAEFEDEHLSFWPDIDEALHNWRVDLLLASGVLQSLPDPYGALEDLLRRRIDYVLIDRLPLLAGTKDRLAVEHVPPEIGEASYPAWFLSEQRVLAVLSGRYEILDRFPTVLDGVCPERWEAFGEVVQNQGFLLRRG